MTSESTFWTIGRAFLDRELYLPEEWANDPERRREAGVPEEIEFATKPKLALGMLERAWEAGVRVAWVTGDEVYGGDYRIRSWLQRVKQPYVLGVRSNTSVSVAAKGTLWPVTVGQVAGAIEEGGWRRLSAGDGAKGPRLYDWALVPLAWMAEEGWAHWLLIRRNVDDPRELAYYLAFAPADTPLTEMVRAAGLRWGIEETIERGKGETGLDEYEVRHYQAQPE